MYRSLKCGKSKGDWLQFLFISTYILEWVSEGLATQTHHKSKQEQIKLCPLGPRSSKGAAGSHWQWVWALSLHLGVHRNWVGHPTTHREHQYSTFVGDISKNQIGIPSLHPNQVVAGYYIITYPKIFNSYLSTWLLYTINIIS